MKKIDIVVPCYNESENIRPLYQAIKDVFTKELPAYDFNLLLVNDGSKDTSLLVLQQLAKEDERVKYLSFSRNFGHQLAVKAGLDHAFAPAVISMDADLQHPPTLIPTLIRKWEEGAQVVATLRTYPEEISKKKRKSSQQFYKLLNLLSDIEIKEGSADFRLLDQAVVEVIRHMRENEPFLRGMVPWVGFTQVYVPYTAQARYAGETKYTIKKMFQLALSGVTSFSVKPLYFAVFLGFFFSLLSVLYVPYVIYSFLNGSEISGWASLIMTIVFFGGLQLIILGIIGVYIGKIFTQTKERPAYIIQEKHL
ncbi:glycosyltransferase family 2 protein [Capnocytophaga granulosa]|jgi:glycosyltransferase|uniref:glycosyltransferase family 2 protein n=1 Tax=Capnocytophaga granulosa TaxID=45242 RepID=UPI0028D52732|nr:glycosyltransferase family 2 protein [Capnocytophaga granulosa]